MESQPTTSETFLRRWQADGDRRALEDLLRIELPLLRERLKQDDRSLLGPSVGATDAAQEAVSRLLEREQDVEFEATPPLRAWLRNTARRFLIDRFRRRTRKQEIGDSLSFPAGSADATQLAGSDRAASEVLTAMQKLSWRDREILDLVYLHQKSTAQAARELGITPDAASMRLSRARGNLREALERRRAQER